MSEENKEIQAGSDVVSSTDVVESSLEVTESLSENFEESSETQQAPSVQQPDPQPEEGHMPPPPLPGSGVSHPHHHHHHHPHGACSHPGAQPMGLQELTGGMKFGWAVVGFMLGWVAILLAWLVNADKSPAVKQGAIKFSLIGFVVACVVCIVATFLLGGVVASIAAGMSSYGYPGYYGMY